MTWCGAANVTATELATDDTVGRTVAVLAGCICAWLIAIGRILAVGVMSGFITVLTVGVGVGLTAAVRGAEFVGTTVVTTTDVSSKGKRMIKI